MNIRECHRNHRLEKILPRKFRKKTKMRNSNDKQHFETSGPIQQGFELLPAYD